jgi:hypothetical protein
MDYKTLKQRAIELNYEEIACQSCSRKETAGRDRQICPNCKGTGRLWRNNWEHGTLSDGGLERLGKLVAHRTTLKRGRSKAGVALNLRGAGKPARERSTNG